MLKIFYNLKGKRNIFAIYIIYGELRYFLVFNCGMESFFQRIDGDLRDVHLHLQTLERATNENNAQPVFQTIYVKLA